MGMSKEAYNAWLAKGERNRIRRMSTKAYRKANPNWHADHVTRTATRRTRQQMHILPEVMPTPRGMVAVIGAQIRKLFARSVK